MSRAAILHHVMIDSGDGGNRSVIAQDGHYVLIPTPDYDVKEGFSTFYEWKVQFQGQKYCLADFLMGNKIKRSIIHADPEFDTWTYGLSLGNKLVNSIIKYCPKGFCIFLGASMRLLEDRTRWAKFLFGVLVLDCIYYRGFTDRHNLLERLRRREDAHEIPAVKVVPRIQRNFHYQAYSDEEDLFIIVGTQQSIKIERPIRLTKWNQDGILEYPFSEWGMKKFPRGYSYIESEKTVAKIWEMLSGSNYFGHPDIKGGLYNLL